MSPVIYGATAPTNTRPDRDVYLTPQPLADASVAYLVDHWLPDSTYRDPGDVLDTGAGSGVWGRAWRNYTNAGYLTGVEVRNLAQPDGYNAWVIVDYLDYLGDPSVRYDVILGNPPFNQAEFFIRRSLALLDPQGVLCYLLPSAFQHGQARGRGLFTKHPPADVVSLMQRPNFDGMGNRQVNDFVLMIWSLAYHGPPCHSWLDWKAQTVVD